MQDGIQAGLRQNVGYSLVHRDPWYNRAHENGSAVISADINSGMNGDNGTGVLVVQSDLTVTIGLLKTGFFTPEGKTHYKELKVADIGI